MTKRKAFVSREYCTRTQTFMTLGCAPLLLMLLFFHVCDKRVFGGIFCTRAFLALVCHGMKAGTTTTLCPCSVRRAGGYLPFCSKTKGKGSQEAMPCSDMGFLTSSSLHAPLPQLCSCSRFPSSPEKHFSLFLPRPGYSWCFSCHCSTGQFSQPVLSASCLCPEGCSPWCPPLA